MVNNLLRKYESQYTAFYGYFVSDTSENKPKHRFIAIYFVSFKSGASEFVLLGLDCYIVLRLEVRGGRVAVHVILALKR